MIKLAIQIQVGRSRITVQTGSHQELMEAAAFYQELPRVCGNCNSEDLILRTLRVTAKGDKPGFVLPQLCCRACRSYITGGFNQETKTPYLKPDRYWCAPKAPEAEKNEVNTQFQEGLADAAPPKPEGLKTLTEFNSPHELAKRLAAGDSPFE